MQCAAQRHRRSVVPPGRVLAIALCLVISATATGRAQFAAMHVPFSEILDLYVRDGQVYYRALQIERVKLDRYVAAVERVSADAYARADRADQIAFWLNAYNAFVLRTVIDRYPIRGSSAEYPASSIRQIPGAFERTTHTAAGRSVTLDQIETEILTEFEDPRLFLALGRGAVGSPRLRSEAFFGARLEQQLEAVAAEFVSKPRLLQVDAVANVLRVSPILSWREAEFSSAYADAGTNGQYASRSPIERAIIHMIEPHLLPTERAMVERNDFTVEFTTFDWRLNDLTGGRVD